MNQKTNQIIKASSIYTCFNHETSRNILALLEYQSLSYTEIRKTLQLAQSGILAHYVKRLRFFNLISADRNNIFYLTFLGKYCLQFIKNLDDFGMSNFSKCIENMNESVIMEMEH